MRLLWLCEVALVVGPPWTRVVAQSRCRLNNTANQPSSRREPSCYFTQQFTGVRHERNATETHAVARVPTLCRMPPLRMTTWTRTDSIDTV